MTHIEIYETDFTHGINGGKAHLAVCDDDDNFVEIVVSFNCFIGYEDESFDHAFGTEVCGYFDIELEHFKFDIIDGEGEISFDKNEIIEVLYAQAHKFIENYEPDYD